MACREPLPLSGAPFLICKQRALVSVGAFTLLAGSCSCFHLTGEEMRLRRPSDSGELGSEPASSVEVVLDDYAPHVFKLLGHWALPVNTHDQDGLTSPLTVSFVRTGKVGFRPLSFTLFSFPSHSQFPAASERDPPPIFPVLGIFYSPFTVCSTNSYSFNRNTFSIYAAHCGGYLKCNCQQSRWSLWTWRLEFHEGHSW